MNILWPIIIFISTFCGIFLYYQRKIPSPLKSNSKNTIFSLTNGRVTKIQKNFFCNELSSSMTKISIYMQWWNRWNIYLPCYSRIEKLQEKRTLILSLDEEHTFHILATFSSYFTPSWKILPGDKGRKGSSIGFCPFGCSYTLFIPSHFNILISKDASLFKGKTLLAKSKQK